MQGMKMWWQILLVVASTLGTSCLASGQTNGQSLQSYVGETLILRFFGGQEEVQVRKGDLGNWRRGCDAAVKVKRAVFEHKRLRFQFQTLGGVGLPGKATICAENSADTRVEISKFKGTESAQELKEYVDQFLQTPEAYLADHGIALEPPNPAGDAVVIDTREPGVTGPKPLSRVNPIYPFPLRSHPVEGHVSLRMEIGTDGAVHEYRMLESTNSLFAEAVLAVLPILRFRPAHREGKAVRTPFQFEMHFLLNPYVMIPK